MISKAVLTSSSDAARYHDSALVEDGAKSSKEADNYYVNETALATWQGKGAALLGIEGDKVSREQFINLLEGRIKNPATGELQDLADNSKGDSRRLGYDFTISPPKSVSIVGLVGQDQRVVDAHIAANATAMAWLEKHAAQIRVKNDAGGNQIVQTENLLYATVQHETSRANDPQLHSHNVIVAVSYDMDGQKWRSLTNDELFRLRASADTIYKNEMAVSLKEAGYKLDYAENGTDFQIRGITPEQLKAYSERTEQRNEALRERGIDPATASYEARQAATLDSRAAKSDVTKSALYGTWLETARETGLSVNELVSAAKQSSGKGLTHIDVPLEAKLAVGRAIDHLSEREQAFKVADLEKAAVEFGAGNVRLATLEKAIADRKFDKSLVDRADEAAPMLTTSLAMSQELTLQNSINEGKGKGARVITDEQVFDDALRAFEERKSIETNSTFRLSREQVNAAKNILMHGDKYQGIQGDAGTGKTAALEFVEEAARNHGWELQGIATSTTGAKELQNATGIKSSTVAAFMVEKDKQLRMLQADVEKLSIDIAHSPTNLSRIKQVERRDMNLSGPDSFGMARYVFDNKTGNVYKSNSGPLNKLNALGHRLSDIGNRTALEARNEWDKAEKFSDRFAAGVDLVKGTAQATLGKQLATYEKVGDVEAVAARTAHEHEKTQAYNSLVRDYERKSAQVANLTRTGHIDGKKYLLVMDESSMTGVKDSARITELARDLGARVVLQGDIKQHGSVAAGRAFEQTQSFGINLSKIEETRRFDNATPQTKRAIEEMKKGNYAGALKGLDTIEVDGAPALYKKVAERYIENRDELIAKGHVDPKIGVVTVTNADRKAINVEVREKLKEAGVVSRKEFQKEHLDDPKMTVAEQCYVPALERHRVNRATATKEYRSLGIGSQETLRIVEFSRDNNTILLEKADGKRVRIDPRKEVNFAYAILEERAYSVGDKVEARANLGKKSEPDRVTNGTRGTIKQIDSLGATVEWVTEGKASTTQLSNDRLRQIDHSYTHTSYKEQGVTNTRQIIAVSEIGANRFNKLAAYVAASRAKDNTEVVTSDLKTMLANAGNAADKTTAIDFPKLPERDAAQQRATQRDVLADKALPLDVNTPRTEPSKGLEQAPALDNPQEQILSR